MRTILSLLSCFLLFQPPASARQPDSSTVAVTELADEYMAEFFKIVPELASFYGIPGADHGAISDRSPEAIAAWHAKEDDWYRRLQELDAPPQSTAAWVTHGFLREALESGRQERVCREELWNVDQLSGWQVLYPLLANYQPTGTDELRAEALRRFSQIPKYVDTEIANLREGLRLGYSAPRRTVERVLEQMNHLVEGTPETSPFFGPAVRDSTPAFQTSLHSLIADSINPAAQRFREFLQEEYLLAARTETAVSANPNGAACYRARTRRATSLDLTPEEIHRLGLETMESIQHEMEEIARTSFGTDDLPVFLDRLRTDVSFVFRTRDEIQQQAEAAIERARAAMPAWFGVLPQADVVVEPIPPHEEASAPKGMYLPPADDGSRPGVYRINLHHAEEQARAPLESVAFHETIPGHHLQIALAMERSAAHPITRFLGSTAFVEGWGLYSERLADEMGLYTSDLDRLGMLSSLAFRAGRLVVDPGLHALGWTREQAVEYMARYTAEDRATIEIEVDRYIITPGQATAYMVGSVEIWRLRGTAQERLADRFDIAAFHDLVLGDGAVTLPMLREKVERWIAERE